MKDSSPLIGRFRDLEFPSSKRFFEEIRPILHHICTCVEILGPVVSPADFVSFRMRELKLDMNVRMAALVKNRGSDPTETVSCHLPVVTHGFERIANRSIAHRLVFRALPWKQILAFAAQCLQQI